MDYQIKNDLHDFEIESNLENLKLMSKDTYKKLIKRKAHDYAFNLLCRSKETYKKLNGLNYYEFKIQNYLLSKDYSLEEKTLIFKYRTRILNLGENFRAGREYVVCPLCKQHKDSQNNLLNCPTLKEDIVKECGDIAEVNLDDLFTENYKDLTDKVLKSVMESRTVKLKGTISSTP